MNKILWITLGLCILVSVAVVLIGIDENRKVEMAELNSQVK